MRRELEELLLDIVALPEDQRQDALVRLCQRYPADADFLRRWYDQYWRLLEDPASTTTPPSPKTPPIAPPAAIGPYQVLGVIGEGGMGTVYRAERLRPVHLTVAIKVVHRWPSACSSCTSSGPAQRHHLGPVQRRVVQPHDDHVAHGANVATCLTLPRFHGHGV